MRLNFKKYWCFSNVTCFFTLKTLNTVLGCGVCRRGGGKGEVQNTTDNKAWFDTPLIIIPSKFWTRNKPNRRMEMKTTIVKVSLQPLEKRLKWTPNPHIICCTSTQLISQTPLPAAWHRHQLYRSTTPNWSIFGVTLLISPYFDSI